MHEMRTIVCAFAVAICIAVTPVVVHCVAVDASFTGQGSDSSAGDIGDFDDGVDVVPVGPLVAGYEELRFELEVAIYAGAEVDLAADRVGCGIKGYDDGASRRPAGGEGGVD